MSKARDDNDVFFKEAINADGWREDQITMYTEMREAGLIDELGRATSKGQAVLLGVLGNKPHIPSIHGARS